MKKVKRQLTTKQMKVLQKNLMLVLLGLITFSCSQEEQKIKPQNPTNIQPAITTDFNCSYSFQGQEISLTNTTTLSPGKYYKKISRGQYMGDQYKFSVRKVLGNGRVVVRSVLEDKRYLWQSPIYNLLDGCFNLNSNGDAITIGPHTIQSPWDNLYYEIIVENSSATVYWSLHYQKPH